MGCYSDVIISEMLAFPTLPPAHSKTMQTLHAFTRLYFMLQYSWPGMACGLEKLTYGVKGRKTIFSNSIPRRCLLAC